MLFPSRDVFVDTSFWYAALDRADTNHVRARELAEIASEEKVQFHSTRDVVSETLTLLRYRAGARAAVLFIDRILGTLSVIDPDPDRHALALAVFRKLVARRRLSYCDALSFVIVRRDLDDAPCLAFDRDFRALGLTVIA